METAVLFYRIYKKEVSAGDYIEWSHSLLAAETSSPSLTILASCSPVDNIFEVESYFNRAIQELAIKQPDFEESARAQIRFLAGEIIKAGDLDYKRVYHLVNKIFRISAVDLKYPEDLTAWILFSDILDSLDDSYDKDFLADIRKEAVRLVGETR